MIQVYNTATRRKEAFEPLEPGRVRMYVCGPTVYDRSHIGHARSTVVFDIIFRYLKWSGFEVTYVRNFTDVDDKIIARANEAGQDYLGLAEENIEAFNKDMGALGVLRADVEPRATEHIAEIVEAVAGLVDKGVAYEVDGDVYFAVDAFPPYGELSGRKLDDLRSGARVEIGEQKRNPLDFALWKSSKPGEPSWESPWGPGRPGWHIECSVMSAKYLGASFDIHGGGADLVFPHHENEKAQAEALTGQPFVKYWLHNGFVRIDAEKMSKSLGNFLTIEEILKSYHPEALRLFLLSAHYRSPLDYTEAAIKEAEDGLNRLYDSLELAEGILGRKGAPADGPLAEEAGQVREAFKEAMDNDFNTAEALGHLFNLARGINRAVTKKASLGGLAQAKETLAELANILGVLVSSPEKFSEELKGRRLKRIEISDEVGVEDQIQVLVDQRTEARKNKDFALADKIRDELDAKGVILKDSPQGTTWKLKG